MNQPATAWISQDLRNGPERIAIIGESGPTLLVLAPFFEEANRTRHFLIETMRDVAARGYRCALPDLPGTLESLAPLQAVTWPDWLDAARGAAEAVEARHIVSLRGGALLDGAMKAESRYRLTPADGAALMRDLVRIRQAADREDGAGTTAAAIEAEALASGFEVAGYGLSADFTRDLKAATLAEAPRLRLARLETEAQPSDVKIAGQPLWRRAEPEHDSGFSKRLADDTADWIASCAAG